VCYGKQVRIEEDPWVGSGEGYKLLNEMVNALHDQGIHSLKDAAIGDLDRTGRSEWKSANLLEIEGEHADRWKTM
jgi:hypothetical protein